jgi:hypothetical protein
VEDAVKAALKDVVATAAQEETKPQGNRKQN